MKAGSKPCVVSDSKWFEKGPDVCVCVCACVCVCVCVNSLFRERQPFSWPVEKAAQSRSAIFLTALPIPPNWTIWRGLRCRLPMRNRTGTLWRCCSKRPRITLSLPSTFVGDFSMGRQSSVERVLDYVVESTLPNSQPLTDHSPLLRLAHPSDSLPYMATTSYADPSNQLQSSASMMDRRGVPQGMNHSSTRSYDLVSSTTSGIFGSPGEMESLMMFSSSTVSASNQPIMTHHMLNNVGSQPLQHLPYHEAYCVAPTMPAMSSNPMATSEDQYLLSILSGHVVASSMEQSVQQSQDYNNVNMHPSLSPLSAQTVSLNSQTLHMLQAEHSGFSPNTTLSFLAGENKSLYSYGFHSPPMGPDDYSCSGASYQAIVGDVNSLTPSPKDYSNCTATEF